MSNGILRADSPTQPVIDVKKAGSAKYNVRTLYFNDFKMDVRMCDEAATCRFSAPSGNGLIVEDETFEKTLLKDKASTVTRMTVGDEHVIVRGIRPKEQLWGAYQFPRPYRLGDRLVVSVHITTDSISTYGAAARWFESRDEGKTWNEVDASVAYACGLLLNNGDRVTFPPCTLKNGATLVCYARPGMFVSVCENASGTRWCEPLRLMEAGDRSRLANIKIDVPDFHQWDGTCGNPELLALDDNNALLFYSDFYYPDESGIKRKTILCRQITVERKTCHDK